MIWSVRRVGVVSAALLLFYLPMSFYQQARAENNNERLLLQLEQQWLASVNNPDALENILADDFIHVLPVGFVTKREQLGYMRAHPPSQPETTRHFENLRVRIYGSAAIVDGTVVADGREGKVRKTIFTDVFAYRGGRWQAVNAQETPFTGPDRR